MDGCQKDGKMIERQKRWCAARGSETAVISFEYCKLGTRRDEGELRFGFQRGCGRLGLVIDHQANASQTLFPV